MASLSKTSSAQHSKLKPLRTVVRMEDAADVERLVTRTQVFSEAEIRIARELVEENLAKGEEASGYSFLFAEGADGIQGYTCFGPISGTHRRYELYWIAVDPDARRQGLARRLQAETEAAVRAMGGAVLIAETSTLPSYAPARGFYVALGFALLAEVPDWHDDGDGLAIFGKRL